MPRRNVHINLVLVCREALVFPRSAHSKIRFEAKVPDKPIWISGDSAVVASDD